MQVEAALTIDTASCPQTATDVRCAHFGQPEQLPAGEPLWPIRDDQLPEIVNTVDEFLDACLFQTHIDRIVVLPNGMNLLRQQDAIPERLARPVSTSSTIRELLDKLVSQDADHFRARLWHYSVHGMEKEVKAEAKSKLLSQKVAALKTQQAAGLITETAPIYVSELRHTVKQHHPIEKDELVKTATAFDVYDCTPLSRCMPLWERSEGGLFFGERGTGSGFHIDQCMWSNVGRNWCGYKLFAIFPWASRFSVVETVGKGKMLHMPLSDEDLLIVQQAKTIALVKPGDAFVFSGAQPHTALCVGDGLNISAYESLVPANSEAVGTLVRSNIKDMHPKMFWMDDEDLDELYEDVVDNMQRTLKRPDLEQRVRSRLDECVTVMRAKGDAYCKELWRQEECGKRRRRREDDASSSDSEDKSRRPSSTSASSGNFSDEHPKSLLESDVNHGPKSKKVRSELAVAVD